ncbi:MAG: GNAT family N-acetyltransferase [Clostridia bacterium]|nr:GNAT family N-acetyltransferase [Clostridia bacterium]
MIRRAEEKDIPKIGDLLSQVDLVHHNGRPDIFKIGRKYSDEELVPMLSDDTRPILVATDENDEVMGYCFCIFQQHKDNSVLTDIKTLYIDDLCVDSALRGKHVGKELYLAAVELAKSSGCYNLTLNVWSCNPSAMRFYEAMGLVPQKVGMELVLQGEKL